MKILLNLSLLILLVSCNSSKKVATESNEPVPQQNDRPQNQRQQGPPDPVEIFSKFDANNDNKLSKDEVKGPLQKDFDKIDSNKDGFISLEELKNGAKGRRPRN